MVTIVGESLNAQDFPFEVKVSGKGQPVILIPGYCCTGLVWEETVLELDSNKYQSHVLSLAGFGGVPGIMTDSYLEDIRDGILRYIETNKMENSILIGHSLGGLLALMVGIESQDPIDKIVCIDSWPFTPAAVDPTATVDSQIGIAKSYFKYDTIPLGVKYSLGRDETRPYVAVLTKREDKVGLLLDMTVTSDDRISNQSMYDMFTIDTRKDLNRIKAPVLIFGTWIAYKEYGVTEESMKHSFNTQYIGLSDKEIHIHSDSRHFIMWDAPEWFNHYLFRFINE